MTPNKFKQLLKEWTPTQPLLESDIIPIGPDGVQIKDQQVIRNLNMAIKAVNSTLRPKLISLITDQEAAKSLKTPGQRVAVIGAIAIAFGITEQDFGQIISKIKSVLQKSTITPTQPTPDVKA